MKCPFRPETEKVKLQHSETTKTYFADCYGKECMAFGTSGNAEPHDCLCLRLKEPDKISTYS